MDMGEVLTLGLYLLQQLGVVLGVGAATLMLVAHLVAARDGVVEPAEATFARTIKRVLMVGLLLMVVSGVAITALHSVAGELLVIFSPAFIFKWILIGVVALPLMFAGRHPFPPLWFEGFVGGTWYALFILHVLAPLTTWVDLLLAYAGWMVVFLLGWGAVARVLHAPNPAQPVKKVVALPSPKPAALPVEKKPVTLSLPSFKPLVASVLSAIPKPKLALPPAKPVAAPTPVPAKPVAALAPVKPVAAPPPAKPALAVPTKPEPVPVKLPTKPEEKVEDPDQHPNLPAVRVMPRTPEDIPLEHRPSVVQFS
jgi:hypothetical protein